MKRRDFTRTFGRKYDGPRLRNPFFTAPAVSKAVKYLVCVGIVVIVLGIPLALVYAPFVRYVTVQVNGLTTLNPNDVMFEVNDVFGHPRAFVIPGRNIFFANTNAIATRLDERFHFEHLALHREGRMLVIDAQERITEIAWTVADKTYFVDLMGIAARDATPEALAMIAARRANTPEVPLAPGVQPTMPIIDVRSGAAEVTLGAPVIPADILANILALDSGLRERTLLPLVYTIEASGTPWLTVTTTSGISLLFDITTQPDNALAMYDAFARERNGDLSALLYIDLRFGNHIYSKNK